MQSPSYKLPHRSKLWEKRQKNLNNILNIDDFELIIQQMNEINEKNEWKKSTFENTKSIQQIIGLLKFAVKCCLEVKTLFPTSLQISFPSEQLESITHTVLTKRQALCLVSNMFFGTTYEQPDKQGLPRYISFTRLSRRPNEIIKTMINYFERCRQMSIQQLDNQSIVFFRIAQTTTFQSWSQCSNNLCQVRFHEKGSIEDLGQSIQIDFANKSIGGFFLSETYTQQDIIFINSPQLMPALLFHKYMQSNQCILMVGAERFSLYTGYLETYKYAGNFKDERKIIQFKLSENKIVNVRDSWISAIDAIPFFIKSEFNNQNLNRELKKSYVGFNIGKLDDGKKAISTGNWGSGAFNGNLEYKFLIQWLAASRANRTIDYFSFANQKAKRIPEIIEKYKNFTVKQLLEVLVKNSQQFENSRKVFDILMQ